MLEALDIATIYFCLFLSVVAATVMMSIVWYSNPDEKAAGFWSASYALGAMTILILALLVDFDRVASAVNTAGSILAFLLYWAGFRAFNHKSTSHLMLFLPPSIYSICCYYFPVIYLDLNINLAIQSAFIVLVSFLNANEILTGPGNLKLSMSHPVAAVLFTHGLFRLIMVFLVFAAPSAIEGGRMVADWWKLLLIEIVLSTSFLSMMTIILLKDRSEHLHRVASETDVLTGLANRRSFIEQCEGFLERGDISRVLAVLDLDHFKSVNDSFGHNAGDKVLSAVARLVADLLPDDAVFGRLGGEEFAIFLPSGHSDVKGFMESVCDGVAKAGVIYEDELIPVTVSIGYATVRQAGTELNLLFTAADNALYSAKQGGRNCVRRFSVSQMLTSAEREVLKKAFQSSMQSKPAFDPGKLQTS